MIMSAFYNTILRQREHSNKWPTTFRLPDMNCTSKPNLLPTLLTSIRLVTFNCLWPPPFLSFHRHTAATNLHGNPSHSVPWEREWAELTSVWTLARGQCQHTNMAHSILPYGAIAYVLAGPGSRTRPWCELLLRTGHITTGTRLIRELSESDVTAVKSEH